MKTQLDTNQRGVPGTSGLAWERILVPVDFTPASIAAIQYAGAVARRDGSSVCLIHVLEPSRGNFDENLFQSSEELGRHAEERLAELARRLLPNDVPLRVLVHHGHPAREILHLAQAVQCDVILLGIHQSPWWHFRWRRGVAQQVMDNAHCSVFLLQSDHASELEPVYWESDPAAT